MYREGIMHKNQPQTKQKKSTFEINCHIICSQQQRVVIQNSKQEDVLQPGREERMLALSFLSESHMPGQFRLFLITLQG